MTRLLPVTLMTGLVSIVFLLGCSVDVENFGPAPEEFCKKWKKIDDPSVTLEFTPGGHLRMLHEGKEYQTTFQISVEKKVLVINTVSLGLPKQIAHVKYDTTKQTFVFEILEDGQLWLTKGTRDGDRHRDNELIKVIDGRFVPADTSEEDVGAIVSSKKAEDLDIIARNASGEKIAMRLADIRAKAKKAAENLDQLKKDRDSLRAYLKAAGFTGDSDLKSKSKDIQIKANDLVGVTKIIEAAKKRAAQYKVIIALLESAERKFRWSKDFKLTSMSKEDVKQISAILAGHDQTSDESDDSVIEAISFEAALKAALDQDQE